MRIINLALLALLFLGAAVEAGGGRNVRGGFAGNFLLDYPLMRPFAGNPNIFGPFGPYAYGNYFVPPPPVEASGLVKANDLIDAYVTEQQEAAENRQLQLQNAALQLQVSRLERERASRPARRSRRSR